IGIRAVVSIQPLQGAVTGRVVHAKTKQPITGATVTLEGSKDRVTTASDGGFRISASAGQHTLHVRAIGFVRQNRQVAVAQNETMTIEILMEPSASVLDEVIVTGTVVATERKAIPTP